MGLDLGAEVVDLAVTVVVLDGLLLLLATATVVAEAATAAAVVSLTPRDVVTPLITLWSKYCDDADGGGGE